MKQFRFFKQYSNIYAFSHLVNQNCCIFFNIKYKNVKFRRSIQKDLMKLLFIWILSVWIFTPNKKMYSKIILKMNQQRSHDRFFFVNKFWRSMKTDVVNENNCIFDHFCSLVYDFVNSVLSSDGRKSILSTVLLIFGSIYRFQFDLILNIMCNSIFKGSIILLHLFPQVSTSGMYLWPYQHLKKDKFSMKEKTKLNFLNEKVMGLI